NEISLKPGMTAVVEILIDDRNNVLTVPVEAVVEQGGKFYSWIVSGPRTERRPLVLGVTNNRFIEVRDGLADGERVLRNPRAVVPEAREEVRSNQKIDVAKTFGEGKPGKADEHGGGKPAGGGSKSGGAGGGASRGF